MNCLSSNQFEFRSRNKTAFVFSKMVQAEDCLNKKKRKLHNR